MANCPHHQRKLPSSPGNCHFTDLLRCRLEGFVIPKSGQFEAYLFWLLAAILIGLGSLRASGADVTSTWDGTNNNWSSTAHWSNFPNVVAFPNNGNGGFTYNAAINSGTVNLDQNIALQKLTLNAATITGAFDLSLNDASTLSGPSTIAGSGLLTINSGGSLSVIGSIFATNTLSRSTVNNGTLTWNSGNINVNDVTFTNNGNFTANVVSGGFQFFNGTSGNNVFNNLGTLTKQGAGTADFRGPNFATAVTFNNSNLVDVQAGTLRLLAGGNHTGTFQGQSGATLQFGGDHTFAPGSLITGNMNVGFYNGNVVWNGASTNLNGEVDNYATLTIAAGRTLSSASGFLNANGAVLKGTGTLAAHVTNSGTLAPGNSPGIIHIDGDYTQTATGTLEIEVGGLTAGTEHDQVIVSGTASIDGNLTFPLVNNPTTGLLFHPQLNDEITFLTANSISGAPKGVFAPNLASVDPALGFVVIKNNQDLRLRFVTPTDVHFVDNSSPTKDWNQASNWDVNRLLTTADKVDLSRSQAPLIQRVEVTSADAFTYQLTIHDQSSPITVVVKNSKTLAAAVGDVIIGRNAAIELGTAGNMLDEGTLATATTKSVLLQDGGQLKGNGDVHANLMVTSGTVAPGFGVGHLDVVGNYQQGASGTLSLQVNGSNTNQFDTIAVSGAVQLGGTLRVDASGLSTPVPGTSIDIMTAGSLTPGTQFDSVETTGASSIYFAPTYLPGVVRLIEYPLGDMNRDGVLNSADVEYFALALMNPRAYFQTIVTPAEGSSYCLCVFGSQSGNMDHMGGLDFDDIPYFATAVGSSPHAIGLAIERLSQVPEPGSGLLVLCFGYYQLALRNRRGSQTFSAKRVLLSVRVV